MKPVILFISLLFAAVVHAQEIPRKASIIIVKGVSFEQVMSKLIDSSGYEVSKVNKDDKYLKTKFKKTCSDCNTAISIRVIVIDSTAKITGKWTMKEGFFSGVRDALDSDEFVYDIKNDKGKTARTTFEAMNSFALSLKREVSYKVLVSED